MTISMPKKEPAMLLSKVPDSELYYTIGEAAKMIGSTVKTVRHYDEVGLLKPTKYTEGGHRLYTTADIWRLELIVMLRYLDFGIEDIRHMMSDDTQVAEALDWQIEALAIKMSTLQNMITILKEAKQHHSSKDSLNYIHQLMDTITTSTKQKNQYIADKIKETKLFADTPPEWEDSVLFLFNKYIVKDHKKTARQTFAWNELKKLINDLQFIMEFKESTFPFIQSNPKFDVEVWKSNLEMRLLRLQAAIEQHAAPNSPVVQAIVMEAAMMMQSSEEQLLDKRAYLRQYAQLALRPRPELMKRFDRLCMIINPEWRTLLQADKLLLQGIQWMVDHLEDDDK
ncbi:MerR family transcriptional regulator [Paenibacillus sp. UMB4589-SE434]|uniref:MerR family transcriptional regulator n=1 Tax=Paenibacillus sp. UMB4589-SE434 TaxID=3046314 RepID=UPI00254E99AE|nr:MerR family transcriptional regulator [Paenibacillus sp. UMB4589-SE434]MDK8182182.1 MerR family transcriptional regulator [Paenibacillus sp. UMB4589-SE434]